MHRNLAWISITHSFSVISANIAINNKNISLKTVHSLAYISAAESVSVPATILRNPSEFDEITVRLGYYAVQGHSRSPILVPIERSYTISY